MDERDRTFSDDERRIAVLLAGENRQVKALREDAQARTPDALVDGVAVEFKSLYPGAGHAAVNHALGAAKRQARHMVIDGREAGLPLDEARRGLRRFLGAHPERLETIRILGQGFDNVWTQDRHWVDDIEEQPWP